MMWSIVDALVNLYAVKHEMIRKCKIKIVLTDFFGKEIHDEILADDQ